MGATRLASGIVQLLFSRVCIVFFSFIFPTRDASPPLELAFGGSVWRRLVLEETLALMGATRLASGLVQLLFSRACIVFFSFIFPTRDASPPLELAFGGSVWRRLVLEETLALMGATRLASGLVQLLFSRACIVFFSFIFPTRDASPPLVLAFCGSTLRFMLAIFAVLYPV